MENINTDVRVSRWVVQVFMLSWITFIELIYREENSCTYLINKSPIMIFTLDISTFPRIPWVIPEIQRTLVGILRAVQVDSIHCAFLKKQCFVSSIPMRYGNISKYQRNCVHFDIIWKIKNSDQWVKFKRFLLRSLWCHLKKIKNSYQ